jgi:PPOX class probable F420-dependent enzyme
MQSLVPITGASRTIGTMPDASPLPDRVRSFLNALNWAAIATVNEDGSPHQALIWYLLDGDTLLINSRRGRRWPTNLERDDRVSLAIHDHDDPEHWVGLQGRARLVRTGEGALADIGTLAQRYGEEDGARFRGQERVTFEIRIERTYEHGS